MDWSWLSALAGGAQGASRGLQGVLDQQNLETERAYRTTRDQQEQANRDRDRQDRETYETLQLLGSGDFALNTPATNAVRDLGSAIPNEAMGLPAAGTGTAGGPVAPGGRFVPQLGDLTPVAPEDQDRRKIALQAALQDIEDKHRPWQPKTKDEAFAYERYKHSLANSSPSEIAARDALVEQRRNTMRTTEVDNALQAVAARFGNGDLSTLPVDQVVAEAANVLAANPRTRPAFKDGTITRNDIAAAAQRALSKQKPATSTEATAAAAQALGLDDGAGADGAGTRGRTFAKPKTAATPRTPAAPKTPSGTKPVTKEDRDRASRDPAFRTWLKNNGPSLGYDVSGL